MRQIKQIYGQYGWVRHGVVPLLFYLVATLLLTFPVVTQLETHVAGAPWGDAFEAVRLTWWTKEALLQGLHPAYQPMLAYPDGFFSPVQWASPMSQLAGLPFALLFSPLVAYNLTFWAASVLTGLAAYLFCWELTRVQSAALLGGLVLVAFPTRMGHATAGHLTLITNYWLLLYAWSLVRLWRGAGIRWAALGGLFFALTAGAYPTALSYELIPLTLVFAGVMAWRNRATWRDWLRPTLVMFGAAVTGFLILYAPLLVGYFEGSIGNLDGVGVVEYSADALAFITPSPFNPVLSSLGLLPGWAGDILGTNSIEGPAYLGLAGITLAVVALWKRRTDASPWLWVALVCMILSLGPVLKIGNTVIEVPIEGGEVTNIAMPYAFYSAVPGLGMGRTPARLNMVTAVAMAALAAYGFAVLIDRLPRLKRLEWQAGALIGLSIVVMVEYQLFAPFPATEAPIPAYLDELADDAANGVVRPVLNLPSNNFFVTRWLLYYQTAHHQPVLAGHIVRDSPANPAMLAMANAAALPAVEGDIVPAMTLDQQAALLRATGADVIIVHREGINDGPEMAAHLVDVLGAPVYEDARVSIFEIPDGPLPDEAIYLPGGGWLGQPESRGSSPGRWFEDEFYISFYLPEEQDGYWEFGWLPSLRDHQLHLDLDQAGTDTFLSSGDEGGIASWRSSSYTQPDWFHQVRFWTDDQDEDCVTLPEEPGCRRAMIVTPCFVGQDEEQALNADFGGTMHLQSVEMDRTDQQARLNFYWQSLSLERADYGMFVHLLDENGESVAQWDGQLGGTAWPTSTWPERGFAFQEASVPLDDLMPGSYQLYAGLYTYPDVIRLPVDSDRPRAQDGLFYLADVEIEPSADG